MMQLMTMHAVAWGAVLADPGDWGHMRGWGWGMAIFGWVFMVAIVGLLVWLIATAIRRPDRPGAGQNSALDLLDERYARGEIDREEYRERRADLER